MNGKRYVKAVHTLRPSKDYKKLTFDQIESLLNLIDEIKDEDKPNGGFSEIEVEARVRLAEIRDAMIAARHKKLGTLPQ